MRYEAIRVATRRAHFIAAIFAASIAMCTVRARAEDATPTRLTVLEFGFFDTSGETRDQEAEHKARLAAMTETLRAEIDKSDLVDIVALPDDTVDPCAGIGPDDPAYDPERDPQCVLARARRHGIDIVLTGVVQKASTMESQMWVSGYDTATTQRVFYRNLSFRGDTDEAWHRASLFLARQIREHPPERP
jgi:hypothetical protein